MKNLPTISWCLEREKLLNYLREAGYQLSILSSTWKKGCAKKQNWLQLTAYFEPRIHGGRGDPTQFSKRQVFEQILAEAGIPGSQLVSFGDGPVEIRDTKELGGVSIAVCSDENLHGSGEYDPFKKQQLIAAGADVAIPDFSRRSYLDATTRRTIAMMSQPLDLSKLHVLPLQAPTQSHARG